MVSKGAEVTRRRQKWARGGSGAEGDGRLRSRVGVLGGSRDSGGGRRAGGKEPWRRIFGASSSSSSFVGLRRQQIVVGRFVVGGKEGEGSVWRWLFWVRREMGWRVGQGGGWGPWWLLSATSAAASSASSAQRRRCRCRRRRARTAWQEACGVDGRWARSGGGAKEAREVQMREGRRGGGGSKTTTKSQSIDR